MWAHARRRCPAAIGDVDVGDGDDTVFDAQDYMAPGRSPKEVAQEIVIAYKAYGKTIEPVVSSTSLEVLSRYCHLSAKGGFYALVKPKKNVQRIVYAHRTPVEILDGVVVARESTAKQHAEYATALFQRAHASAGTPVVRRLCLAAGNYQRRKAEEFGFKNVRYSPDDIRRRPELKEREVKTLADMEAEAIDYVEKAECSYFVMVHWLHFPYGTTSEAPTGKKMVAAADEWKEADQAMAEVMIQDEDIVDPEGFMTRCHMTKTVAEALGVESPILLRCCCPGAGPSAPPRSDGGKGKGKKSGGKGKDVPDAPHTGSVAKGNAKGKSCNKGKGGQRKHGPIDHGNGSPSTSTDKSSGKGKGKAPGKGKWQAVGRSERSRTGGVAPSGNTGGMATVPGH